MKAVTLGCNPVEPVEDLHRGSLDGMGYTQVYLGEML